MLLKKERNKKKSIFNIGIFFKIYFFVSIFAILIIFFLISKTSLLVQYDEKLLHRIHFNGLNYYPKVFKIVTQGILGKFTKKDEININLSLQKIVLLEENRKEILKNTVEGLRDTSIPLVKVRGSINFQGNTIPIEISLKGDRDTHYNNKKYSSYKIKIKGNNRLMGLRKFSLIKPRARNYIHEWLFHEFTSLGGLIKIKYIYLNLKMNGNKQGLYVLEEGFDKELIERNKRRNGPIFSLFEEYDSNVYKSKIEFYNKAFWEKSENKYLKNVAVIKFNAFLKGKSKVEETFDVKKWAWFFATMDLTYTSHGASPRNVKFYYNPLSSLIEPIPFDGHRTIRNFSKNLANFKNSKNDRTLFDVAKECATKIKRCRDINKNNEYFTYNFFYEKSNKLNTNFYSLYLDSINKISDKNFLDSFFKKKKNTIKKINRAIYGDYFLIDNTTYGKYGPGLYYFDINDIFHRAGILQRKIKSKGSKLFIKQNDSILFIENNDENNLSLVAKKLICTEGIVLPINQKIEVKGVVKLNHAYDLKDMKCTHIKFKNIFNDKEIVEIIHQNYNNYKTKKTKHTYSKKYLNYFTVSKNYLLLKKNNTLIAEDIYIPANYTVKILPGERINIINKSKIISDSNWIVGDKNNSRTVIIGGTKANFGGGIVIKKTQETSYFFNTHFNYLSGLSKRFFYDEDENLNKLIVTKYDKNKINNYLYSTSLFDSNKQLTYKELYYLGALNFYKTNVKLYNSKFTRIDAEDAINIISTKFLIDNLTFKENKFDAVDLDYSNGVIKNSNFENILDDAVDLSESNAYLKNLTFNNIGDKMISAGENTIVNINNIKGSESYIGIATKDGAHSYIENITLKNVVIPFASYQKKKSYMYGNINIKNPINIKNYKVEWLQDFNSTIVVNDRKIKNYYKNINNFIDKKIDYSVYNDSQYLIKK